MSYIFHQSSFEIMCSVCRLYAWWVTGNTGSFRSSQKPIETERIVVCMYDELYLYHINKLVTEDWIFIFPSANIVNLGTSYQQ